MPKVPNDIDFLAGSRIRMRRQFLGMSQTVLGQHLGITFQQVQKYEKGTNRVSASRLHRICEVLNLSVAELFDESGGREQRSEDDQQGRREDVSRSVVTKETMVLNKAFLRIDDPALRSRIISMVEAISNVSAKRNV